MANKSEIIYQDIKNGISNGEYLPGVRLIESDLVNKYNVSRSTIREVLSRLIDDEVVEAIPNKGISIRKVPYEKLNEYYIVLEYLSGLSARLAAENCTDELIATLTDIWNQNQKALVDLDYALHIRYGNMFHKAIDEGSKNAYLIKQLDRIYTIVDLFPLIMPLESKIKTSLDAHKQIIQAIQSGDACLAENIMRQHMREFHEISKEFLANKK